MKKVKITFWILVIIFLGLLVWQNQDYFFAKHSLGINLYFTSRVTPDVYNLVIIAVFFASGLLIAYLSSLFERFRAKKTIKELRNANNSNQETIGQMRREVDALKTPAVSPGPPVDSQTADDTGVAENSTEEPTKDETTAQPSQS